MALTNSPRRLRKNKRAISPAISTTILTSAIIVMLLVTITFVNNYLNGQIAQDDFNSMKQFMQTLGLQVDDVAWIPGRTQTLTYASKYGQVTFRSPALTYSFYFDGSLVTSFSVGAILFNIPIRDYSVANNYFEEIFPSSNSLLQNGTSAPICRVFITEKLPMQDGSYIRIVVAPIVRQLNSMINNVNYARFYLPILNQGSSPQLAQSVTLTGINVPHQISSNVNNVTITVAFPNGVGMGLTWDFFNFAATSQTVNLGSSSVVEIYGGNVTVSLGVSA
jgi:predicted lactoylglutathione lyase